jgi:hypothetical protein
MPGPIMAGGLSRSSVTNTLVPFIVGLVVSDLDRALDELAVSLGFNWSPVVTAESAGWSLRVVYAQTSEPYFQVIEGQRDSPWDPRDGPRLDHVDIWAGDYEADSRRLEAAGFVREIESTLAGRTWRLYRASLSRLRVELHYPNQEAAAARRSLFGLVEDNQMDSSPRYTGVGLYVKDLAAAADEISCGLGMTFLQPTDAMIGSTQTRTTRTAGMPYIRLTEWPQAESAHQSGAVGIDHLIYATSTRRPEEDRIVAAGMTPGDGWTIAGDDYGTYSGAWSGLTLLLGRSRAFGF